MAGLQYLRAEPSKEFANGGDATLAPLAARLQEAEIRYSVLHGWQSLPRFLPSDLDLIVAPDDLARLEETLQSGACGKLVQLLQHQTTGFYFVLAQKVNGRSRFTLLDAATDFRRDGRVYFNSEDLLRGRRLWKGFWVAAPEAEFNYLLVKKISKGELSEPQKQRLQELQRSLGKTAFRIATDLFGAQRGTEVVNWLARSDWTTLEAELPRLKSVLRRQAVMRYPLSAFYSWLAELKRIGLRCRYPTGIWVAVLGPDGAGKSTLIEGLSKSLAGAFRNVEAFHLRPRMFGRRGDGAPVIDPHGKPPHPWWLSLLKVPYYLMDYGFGYWLRVRPRLVKSTAVFFDRYYDDLLVDPYRYRYGGPPALLRRARWFVPEPDLFLILDAGELQLLERKKEVSADELRRQRQGYKQLALSLPRAVLLDGSLPAAKVAEQAHETILDFMQERYLRRRHLWFSEFRDVDLKWLASVLFTDAGKFEPTRTRQNRLLFAPNVVREEVKKSPRLDRSFAWLALKDGRGFLLPLESSRASARALELYPARTRKARAFKKMMAVVLKSGAGGRVLPQVQCRLRCGDDDADSVSLLEHLKAIFNQTDMSFGIGLGTLGPQRKPVIQMIDGEGQALAYAKVGWNEQTRRLVENEKNALEFLTGRGLQYGATARLLYFGYWNQRAILITEPLPLNPAVEKLTDFDDCLVEFLVELGGLQKIYEPFHQTRFFTSLRGRVQAIKPAISSRDLHTLEEAIRLLRARLGSREIPWIWSLGDLAPWNIGYDAEKRKISVIDLEYAHDTALPGWDLFHFLTQPLERNDSELHEIYGKSYDRICSYFRRVDVEPNCIPLFHLAYLLDRWTLNAEMWEASMLPKSARALAAFRRQMAMIQILSDKIRNSSEDAIRVSDRTPSL